MEKITKKIPVKIVKVQDIHGTENTSMMLDLSYYFESKDKSNKRVQQFKNYMIMLSKK